MNFKPGDFIIRINDNYHEAQVGETYEVRTVLDEIHTSSPQLVLKEVHGIYESKNFVLSPISGTPLVEALK